MVESSSFIHLWHSYSLVSELISLIDSNVTWSSICCFFIPPLERELNTSHSFITGRQRFVPNDLLQIDNVLSSAVSLYRFAALLNSSSYWHGNHQPCHTSSTHLYRHTDSSTSYTSLVISHFTCEWLSLFIDSKRHLVINLFSFILLITAMDQTRSRPVIMRIPSIFIVIDGILNIIAQTLCSVFQHCSRIFVQFFTTVPILLASLIDSKRHLVINFIFVLFQEIRPVPDYRSDLSSILLHLIFASSAIKLNLSTREISLHLCISFKTLYSLVIPIHQWLSLLHRFQTSLESINQKEDSHHYDPIHL
jgi:hypothetical protein